MVTHHVTLEATIEEQALAKAKRAALYV